MIHYIFYQPDLVKNDWRLMLTLGDLEPDRPRIIEAGGNRLILQLLKD